MSTIASDDVYDTYSVLCEEIDTSVDESHVSGGESDTAQKNVTSQPSDDTTKSSTGSCAKRKDQRHQTICKFYGSMRGCKKKEDCPFLHIDNPIGKSQRNRSSLKKHQPAFSKPAPRMSVAMMRNMYDCWDAADNEQGWLQWEQYQIAALRAKAGIGHPRMA